MARKILLADDSVTAQNMGRKILADAGYEVITVNNGSAALKRVADARPDLIVLDVYMPGYSGLEVCQRLKEASDTARIPILLTVGKLEPFKPEEAKRARADAFIVKPFEASELLSALTKLEDKIVPRPETSKPGRFARAIAAVEEGRYDKSVAIEEDSGWKDRISFPSKKKNKAAEREDEEDPSAYNPVNKDLRTVVEQLPERRPQDASPDNARLDLAALAPQGLPKDVTPEEIAALAAAAAQIKGTPRGHEEKGGPGVEDRPAENATPKDQVTPAPEPAPLPPIAAQPTLEASAPEVKAEGRPEAKEERAATLPAVEAVAKQETKQAPKKKEDEKAAARAHESGTEKEAPSLVPPFLADFAPAIAGPEPVAYTTADQGSGNGSGSRVPADEPMTMAATAGSEFISSDSRWMAVPVALLPEEAALSLEQEMQKAHAAFAAAEAVHTAQTAIEEAQPAAEPAPALPVPAPSVVHEVAETMGSVAGKAADAFKAAVKECETVAAALVEAEPPAPVEPETAPVQASEAAGPAPAVPPAFEARAEEKPAAYVVTPQPEAASLQVAPESAREEPEKTAAQKPDEPSPAEAAGAAPAALAPSPNQEKEESAVAAPAPVSEVTAATSLARQESPRATEATAPAEPAAGRTDEMAKKEKDIAATTAAAWASWRRVRESADYKSQASPQDEDEAAMAVAAGAENAPGDGSPESGSESGEIATIVDSVLADLRPKIVEEISKKLGKKKK